MRAFNSKQTEALLNAFGEQLEINGVSFKAILKYAKLPLKILMVLQSNMNITLRHGRIQYFKLGH